ncbi:hypothetical protein ACFYU9_29845 [Streptomyces sp. NPDC004327]|uniref:hypothetical protein n=1 Tax=Streptomyces sp. NPDC004327 TaxID=3364699 RepID=UPI0036AA0E63
MGKWAVVAQYGLRQVYVTEILSRVEGTREEAREALLEATRRYHPPRREHRRQVYRLPGGDSYLLVVEGAVSRREITLSLAELVYDSAAPSAVDVHGPEQEPASATVAPEAEPEAAASEQEQEPEPLPEGARPAPAPEPRAWDADVPERPAWWGRTDLPESG